MRSVRDRISLRHGEQNQLSQPHQSSSGRYPFSDLNKGKLEIQEEKKSLNCIKEVSTLEPTKSGVKGAKTSKLRSECLMMG